MKFWPFQKEQRSRDPSWNALTDRGALSASGAYVDSKTAEGLSAVFACVQALSESTACLPLHVYKKLPNGDRQRADDHPLARVLRRPNAHQSGLDFREQMTAAVLLHGNAYAQIESNGVGEIVALNPLHPVSVNIVKLPSGRHAYEISEDDGKLSRLLETEVLHLRDRSEPGSIIGKSRISIARDTVGLGLSLRQHGESTFRNGARISGVLQTDKSLTREQLGDLSKSWRSQFSGAENVGRTAILENGLKYQPMAMSLADAEWLAAQQFSVEEICRIFRVPPTMVGDLRHGNYSNTAELGSQFVRYSLQRWIAMWEAEITRSLLHSSEQGAINAEHSVEGLLRGNPEARAGFYASGISAGWLTVNEVRKLENLPTLTDEP